MYTLGAICIAFLVNYLFVLRAERETRKIVQETKDFMRQT